MSGPDTLKTVAGETCRTSRRGRHSEARQLWFPFVLLKTPCSVPAQTIFGFDGSARSSSLSESSITA
jgi:hypothetical protein